MASGPLLARVQAYAAACTEFNTAHVAATAQLGVDPAVALPLLDAAMAQVPALHETALSLLAAGFGDADSVAQWRERTISLLESRRMAAVLLADAEQLSQTRAMAQAALSGESDDPYWATLWEQDATAATSASESDRLLDLAFARRVVSGDVLAAARNRVQAASLAAWAGRLARARGCADEAIDLARQHDLRREQVNFRMSRFTTLLIADQAGAARQELKAELDFVSRPRGILPDALERIYAEGLAALDGPEAAQTAAAFGLMSEAQALAETSPGARKAAVDALSAQRDSQRLSLLLLAAQFKGKLGDWDTPTEAILPPALKLAKTPQELARVYGAMADAAEGAADTQAAIAAMAQAVTALQSGPSATLLAQARARLAALRADGTNESRDPAMDPDDYATRRSDAAVAALQAGQPMRALSILDSLRDVDCTDFTRGKLATLRGVALYESDRPAEAKAAFTQAADIFEPALDQDPGGEGDWLGQRETALLLLAVTLTRLGCPRDAWIAAERARSPKLARALGVAAPAWPALRDALQAQRAAVLTVQALRWGTLVMSAAPGDAEPQAVLLTGFRSADMNRLLVRDLGDDSDAWNGVLMEALPALSAGLAQPLANRLRELAAAADILYLIPDAALWYAPWAGMAVAPSLTLAELVPFSLLPFARLLLACPPNVAPRRNTLAMAVGQDNDGFSFTGHLDLLAPLLAPHDPAWLRDGAVDAAALRDARPRDLLYVSCHGTIDHSTPEVDRASQLMLADGPLPAAALAGWHLGQGLGAASLTFLNACQTGRFRAAGRTELGGFPAAFLRAGRRTLIAPLTHVDPKVAGALAQAFFTAFLAAPVMGGPSAASSLRTARLALRDAGAPTIDWAAYSMFGPDA